MQAKALYQRYSQSEIRFASQKKLILLLYDGAINFLKRAQDCICKKDIEGTHNFLVKARKIINELMLSLNPDLGGDLAKNLFRLYWYMMERVLEANFKKSVDPINEVLMLLEGLREAWANAKFEENDLMNINNREVKGRLCISG